MIRTMHIIGATAVVQEVKSGIEFSARVDTGAKTCSMHVEEMVIEDESEDRAENMGKTVRFQVKNKSGESAWLEGKIVGRVIIKNSQSQERRYKVRLTFRWNDFEKRVRVTLNDRSDMEFPLLLGRNWLRRDFLVNVDMDNEDPPRRD